MFDIIFTLNQVNKKAYNKRYMLIFIYVYCINPYIFNNLKKGYSNKKINRCKFTML